MEVDQLGRGTAEQEDADHDGRHDHDGVQDRFEDEIKEVLHSHSVCPWDDRWYGELP